MIKNNVKQRRWSPDKGDEVKLHTDADGANITARYESDYFTIIEGNNYVFGLKSCREAAEFFTLLGDILEDK